MENIFFKYGIIIVGGVVIMLLISFAYSAINNTIKIPQQGEKGIDGEKSHVVIEIEKLCTACLKDDVDKDCNIEDIDSEGEIVQEDFMENIVLSESLPSGQYTIKLSVNEGICNVRKIG
ncbi:MAG: hypothetical protein KKF44_08275 [Nanoarchaeota archaeon]|nr:hypothetical protein [Nanoarchaeota archaeon]